MPRFLSITALVAALALAGCQPEVSAPNAVPSADPPNGCASGDMLCAGQRLADARCARCHAAGKTGTSPYPGAQPFRVFWQRWTRPALFSALKTGIIVEHDRSGVNLPEMKLDDYEIKALFTYLDTIQEQ